MHGFGISYIKNFFKSAREKFDDAINYGYKKYGDFSSSMSQISQKYRKKLRRSISSYDRSLIRKSDNRYREKKIAKVLHMTPSEYWKDTLFNHWYIFIQCLVLMIIVIIISPWIGSDCNSESTFEESYFDHRPDLHLRQFRRSMDERTSLLSSQPCSFLSFFSSGNNQKDRFKKRSGILRRKRAYRRFY